jgi:hypothetical protein
VATDHTPTPREPATRDLVDDWVEPVIVQEETDPKLELEATPMGRPLRGSLANSIAKTQPSKTAEPKKTGPTRI